MKRIVLLLLVTLALPVSVLAQSLADVSDLTPYLKATLQMDQQSVRASDPVRVRFTLQNVSSQALSILRWHTPLEGVWADIFSIEHDGAAVRYRGPLAARATPSAESYLFLEPGKTVSAVVDLSTYYAIEKPGAYRVRLRAEILDLGFGTPEALAASLGGQQHLRPRPLSANEVTFRQTGTLAISVHRRPQRNLLTTRPAPKFIACDPDRWVADRQDPLLDALQKARVQSAIAAIALALLPKATRPSSERYAKWFGAYDAGRWDTVAVNFNAISRALLNEQIDFECDGCRHTSDTVAYVTPDEPFLIYICDRFFTLPLEGPDGQALTLIHEMSHFNVVAGTRDIATDGSCQLLAKTKPSDAIRNADSYGFFGENNPYVLMYPGESLTAASPGTPPPRP